MVQLANKVTSLTTAVKSTGNNQAEPPVTPMKRAGTSSKDVFAVQTPSKRVATPSDIENPSKRPIFSRQKTRTIQLSSLPPYYVLLSIWTSCNTGFVSPKDNHSLPKDSIK